LLTLLNDILDFSKIEAGHLTLDTHEFSIRDCVKEVVALFQFRAREKNLALTARVADGVPAGVVGDPARLRQILVNLVGNALKFTSAGSVAIEVETRPAAPGKVVCRFAVTDTGPGIPESKRELIFRPFEQADGSITRQYGGTGLGLAICRSLVERMHGAIGVESEAGRGSTFFFTAEFAGAAGSGLKRVPATEPAGAACLRGLRFLLAEDNAVNLMVATRLLEKRGATVVPAEDGRAAVEALRTGDFDVVLMDVQMPVMDGYEATRRIRDMERGSGGHTPILACTANAMKGDDELCFAAGMDGYISKPIRVEELVAKIGDVLTACSPRG
jgi:CheY-like chemotaxis protein